VELVELSHIAKGLPRALKNAAEKDGLPAKIFSDVRHATPTREFLSKYPGTLGRIKAHYEGKTLGAKNFHQTYLTYGPRWDKSKSLAYAKARANKGKFESSLSGQRAEAYRQERLKRTGLQDVGKNDLVSERVKAGMSPSPISAPARAKNGRLLNLSTMGDRQPVLGRGKPFRNGKVVP